MKSPKERYREFDEVRNKMKEYSGFKTQQRFFKQRERLLMGNWRHGVLGRFRGLVKILSFFIFYYRYFGDMEMN